jgi:carboxymethylenebutenolidase
MTDQNQNSYLAIPASGTGPGVLVLHAWWGLTDVIRDLCDRLAQEGFVALAPDLFSGALARTIEEAEQHNQHFDEVKLVPPIVLSAAESLRSSPVVSGEHLGVIGFSFGADWSLWLSDTKPDIIRAVTVFYGAGFEALPDSEAAYLGHFAEKDPYVSSEQVKKLETSLRAANRPVQFYTYPGTTHWFFESDRPEYNPPAAQTAWERTVEFLHQNLE